ncbi:GNAT family N-acetyltransferase [Microbacterium pseudoresistens]|uniref:Phosphinothricin acetyltransferase n=1 Tax=Microbacterium pseudoresistens TaxID=640634 RepID=A0A7Y9EW27_9MICO|nr:phosphinothricin acetyltransferase [Microbacterium pseudoresistens]
MTEGVHFRPASPDDLIAVRDIYNHYVRESTVTFDEVESTTESWRDKHAALVAAGLPFLVAEEHDGVLGYGLVQPFRPKSAYRFTVENSIYLAPETTGRGVGEALLRALLSAATDAGVREVVAVIEPTSAAGSIRLHRRLGFVDVGTLQRVGVKFGRSLDTAMLQLSLPR